MKTLKTINTIELSSKCNLACKYCVNRLIEKNSTRKPGIMSEETFEKTLLWLKKLIDQGTQKEVNLNGNGESTLDPDLLTRIARVKSVVGNNQVGLCTNGLLMTNEYARKLKDSGIDKVDVSPHSFYHARKAVQCMFEVRMNGVVSMGAVQSPHNWAEQLADEHSVKVRLNNNCDPLIDGRGYVQSEGNVTPCCYDYRNLGVFGSVYSDNLLSMPIYSYSLCHQCHQKIPDSIKSEVKFIEVPGEVCV